MLNYSVAMARSFGIEKPKVALISATEKVTAGLPNTLEYAQMSQMAARGQIKNCIVDGPLDVFGLRSAAAQIKGIKVPLREMRTSWFFQVWKRQQLLQKA